jgi:hypothetical protein
MTVGWSGAIGWPRCDFRFIRSREAARAGGPWHVCDRRWLHRGEHSGPEVPGIWCGNPSRHDPHHMPAGECAGSRPWGRHAELTAKNARQM